MTTKNRHIIYFLLAFFILFPCLNSMYAQMPFFTTGKPGSEGDFLTIKQHGSLPRFTTSGIQLTAGQKQGSAIVLDGLEFSNSTGFNVSFEYIMDKGKMLGGKFGDGLNFILFNANQTAPQAGNYGSALGYAYSKASGSSNSNGFTDGFLGIALDTYGGYKNRLTDSNEYRNGAYRDTNTGKGDHITVRGPGNGLTGYPVLLSQASNDAKDNKVLNIKTGEYTTITHSDPSQFEFTLRGVGNTATSASKGHKIPTYGETEYRKVSLKMLPGTENGEKGFYLNLLVTHEDIEVEIIKDFFFPNQGTIHYSEATSATKDVSSTYNYTIPSAFKIAFAASTGDSSQNMYIQNINVSIPYSPIIKNNNKIENICSDSPSTFSITDFVIGFANNEYSKGTDIASQGSSENIDMYSFRFRKLVNNQYIDNNDPYSITTTHGNYKFNPKKGEITFYPNTNTINATTITDQIYFDIKNKAVVDNKVNLGSELFRSEPGEISIKTDKKCKNTIMVNGSTTF